MTKWFYIMVSILVVCLTTVLITNILIDNDDRHNTTLLVINIVLGISSGGGLTGITTCIINELKNKK